MAVLDLIKKVKVQTLSFENHPCRDLDMETKVHYLNALALVSNEDGTIAEEEKEYLAILINSFGLSADTLSEYIEFAKNPDESQLVEMMNAFSTKDIKYNLMVDAMMIAQRDGEFSESEKALIEQYFEMFKISEQEAKDLTDIFEMLHAQDARGLSRYFNRNKRIKQSLFTYFIEYYKIDLEYALKEEEKELLTFKWFQPSFGNGGLEDAKEIMKEPISNAQFFIYLNARYDANSITVEENRVLLNDEEKTPLMELEYSDISFVNGEFRIEDSTKDDEKITGITAKAVEDFVQWINDVENCEYKIVRFFISSHTSWPPSLESKNLTTVFRGNEFVMNENKIKIYKKLSKERIYATMLGLMSLGSNSLCSNEISFRLMR